MSNKVEVEPLKVEVEPWRLSPWRWRLSPGGWAPEGGGWALEVEPLKVEVEPLKVEVEPLKVEVEPLKVEVEPLKVEVEPLKVGVEPLKVGVEPLKVGVEPLKVGVEPLKVEVGTGRWTFLLGQFGPIFRGVYLLLVSREGKSWLSMGYPWSYKSYVKLNQRRTIETVSILSCIFFGAWIAMESRHCHTTHLRFMVWLFHLFFWGVWNP